MPETTGLAASGVPPKRGTDDGPLLQEKRSLPISLSASEIWGVERQDCLCCVLIELLASLLMCVLKKLRHLFTPYTACQTIKRRSISGTKSPMTIITLLENNSYFCERIQGISLFLCEYWSISSKLVRYSQLAQEKVEFLQCRGFL